MMHPDRDQVIVDIDDTLHANQACIRQVAAEHDIHFELDDLVEWRTLVELCGGLNGFLPILEETYQRQHDDPEWSPIFPGALEAMQHLDALGYEIHYCTDRPPSHAETTPLWLAGHNFPQAHNTHVCHDKRETIIELGAAERALMIVDDRPRTMDWAHHTLGIPHVLALRFAHNRCMSDMEWAHMADDWQGLRAVIDQISFHAGS